MSITPIERVAKFYGSKSRMAKQLGITKGAVSQWKYIPQRHLQKIISDTSFSIHVLRPDFFEGRKQ